MTPTAVSARRLGRRFRGHWAVARVGLDIGPGESLLIAGANGSGKTTLLRLIAGLLRPSRGSVRVFGHEPSKHREAARRRLTFVSHHAYLYDGLTAIEMLRLWCRLGVHPGSDHESVAKANSRRQLLGLLDRVDLAPRADDQIATFSAGMRKRLTLLRTAIERPDLILLDEPFAALDPPGQDMIERWLADFRTQGQTVIVASHSLERARRACQNAVLMEQGQIVWRGEAAELSRVSLVSKRSTGATLAAEQPPSPADQKTPGSGP